MKKITFLIVSLFLFSCGGSSGSSGSLCGLIGTKGKIINGSECDASSSPVVLISIEEPNGPGFVCTGTLITSNAVLSAAHCVPSDPGRVIVTVAGRSILASGIFIPAGYGIDENQGLIFNDLAIIQLSEPVVAPTLPIASSLAVQPGDELYVYGYGIDEEGIQGVLRAGDVAVQSKTTNHIFSNFDGSRTNACGGDSGGPLVAKFVDGNGVERVGVVGIVSTGSRPDCAIEDVTGFTNLNSVALQNYITTIVPGAVIF